MIRLLTILALISSIACGDDAPEESSAAAAAEAIAAAAAAAAAATPTTPEAAPAANAAGELCTNTCSTANDGDCDDGGPNSQFDLCAFGTDCGDCGARQESQRPAAGGGTPPAEGANCTNTCDSANDGECDDGGPNSLYDVCALGTDCADCGPR